MEPEIANDATTGWWCSEHGYFVIACSCGVLTGQPHDVLCPKRPAENV